MPTATLTSKGQITIPKEVRDDLNLTTGSKVIFVKLPSGHYRIVPRTGSVEDFINVLYDPARPPMSIEEINDAIADGGAASGLRGMR